MLARERIVVAVMRTRNTGGDIVTAPATAVLASARMRGDVRPYLADADCVLYHGDVLDVLREMPDESVDCAATSPPFYGLRNYGVDGQIGLESTPEEWRDRLVEVFRELRRVLVPTGTLWVECGDSYSGGGGFAPDAPINQKRRAEGSGMDGAFRFSPRVLDRQPAGKPQGIRTGCKPKDLIGAPFLLAFGLRDDGWWWRSTNIWHKPNCLPESVRDRPVVSHSYVFQFAKGQWKSRVVQLANLPSQFFHLGDDLGAEGPYVWTCDLSVRLATAISNSAQFQNEFSLAPLDSEVWQQGSYDDDSRSPGGLPVEHRPAVLAARFLNANLPAKEFLSELYRLGVALSDSYHLVIGGGLAEFPLPPGVTPYGKTAIRIEHPGEIRKFDLAHGTIVEERPVRCSYFHDAEAVREPAEWARWGDQTVVKEQQGKGGWIKPNSKEYLTQGRTTNGPRSTENREQTPGFEQRLVAADGTKSLRSVWTIPTQGYPEAHFATWPEALARRIILAACPEAVCSVCGKARERIVERGEIVAVHPRGEHDYELAKRDWTGLSHASNVARDGVMPGRAYENKTTGFTDCGHNAYQPGVVLDPSGSGTTNLVARKHGRRSVGIDLNSDYLDLAARRLQQQSLFAVTD